MVKPAWWAGCWSECLVIQFRLVIGGLVADWSLTQRACWWVCWWSDCLASQVVGRLASEVLIGWPFSFAWSFSLVWWVGFGRLVVDWSLNQRVSWWVVWMAKSAD